MATKFAKLKKINPKSLWKREEDFSRWLAADGFELLRDAIGIDMEVLQTEARVGSFRADILAEETSSERKIVIENQFGKTNHDHLGKQITYASGRDASIVVWVVENLREEHQKAVEWLNEHTYKEKGFFIVQIQVFEIEGSNPAPAFCVLVSPNAWANAVKSGSQNLPYLQFWEEFSDFAERNDPGFRLQRPRAARWRDVHMDRRRGHILLAFNAEKNYISCGFYIRDKTVIELFKAKRKQVEKAIGKKLYWKENPGSLRIDLRKTAKDLSDIKDKQPLFEWFYENSVSLKKVYAKFNNQ